MKEYSFEVPDEYPDILLCLIVLCLECIIINYFIIVPARMKAFGPEFMEQFKNQHEKALGQGAALLHGGLPDSGNGLYADKLEYKQWFELNNAIRVH